MEFCPKFGLRIEYDVAGYFDSRPMINFCLGWGAFYFHLPFDTGIQECEPPSYGFYWFESALWIKCGKKCYAFHSPWSWDWYRTSYLLKDGKWETEVTGKRRSLSPWNDPLKSLLWSENYPYCYTLKSGVVQNRRANITISEREWRRKFLMWTSLFNKVHRSLDVEFDGEVGEETGSWKGGTIGCGTDIQEGEEPLTVLRRMESTRKF
jgi:hypothetical protein